MKLRSLMSTTAMVLAMFVPGGAFAATTEELSQRIAQLEKEIALLKRQQEVTQEVQSKKEEKQANVELGTKGLSVESPDKNFTMKVRGYAQFDGRFFLNDEGNTGKNDFLARRIRPVIQGTIYRDFSYKFMPEFAGDATSIEDAYLEYAYSDPFHIRAGKFKPPLGLERLQSSSDITFMERGHPANLSPSRDYGVMLLGEPFGGGEYQLGIFNGDPDLSDSETDSDDHKDVIARVFVHPFAQSDVVALHGLGVGVAGSVGDRDGSVSDPILTRYRSPGQQTFFRFRSGTTASDTSYADGTQWRVIPQGYFYHNNWGLLAEYAVSTQDVTRASVSDTLTERAWQLQGSYVLTGEDVNYKGSVIPKRSFDPIAGGWGAFELATRVGQTDIDDDAFPFYADPSRSASQATSWGAGINWFLNSNIAWMLNYDFTEFDGGASGGGDRPDEHAVFSRVQFRY